MQTSVEYIGCKNMAIEHYAIRENYFLEETTARIQADRVQDRVQIWARTVDKRNLPTLVIQESPMSSRCAERAIEVCASDDQRMCNFVAAQSDCRQPRSVPQVRTKTAVWGDERACHC